jgi:hypothetical protein
MVHTRAIWAPVRAKLRAGMEIPRVPRPAAALSLLARILGVLLAIAVLAAVGAYMFDVITAVSHSRAAARDDLQENCQNATKLARFTWVHSHCVIIENGEKVRFERQVLDVIITDLGTLILVLARDFQPLDVTFIKFAILFAILVGGTTVCATRTREQREYAYVPPQFLSYAPPRSLGSREDVQRFEVGSASGALAPVYASS